MAELALQYNFALIPIDGNEVRIGRGRSSTVTLAGALASRDHAIVRKTPQGLVVTDLKSKNGTWVNGQKVEHERRLELGDQIKVGTDVLYVVEHRRQDGREDAQQLHRTTLCDTESPEDVTRVDHASVIELVEVLVESCVSEGQRPATTRAVVNAVDELIERAGLSQPYLKRADAQRVRLVADRVAAWWPDEAMQQWRRSLEGRLSSAIDHSPTPAPR